MTIRDLIVAPTDQEILLRVNSVFKYAFHMFGTNRITDWWRTSGNEGIKFSLKEKPALWRRSEVLDVPAFVLYSLHFPSDRSAFEYKDI